MKQNRDGACKLQACSNSPCFKARFRVEKEVSVAWRFPQAMHSFLQTHPGQSCTEDIDAFLEDFSYRMLPLPVLATEAVISIRAILEPGDHVVCMRPAYQSLYEHAVNMGCSLSYWDCQSDAFGRLYFDVSTCHFIVHNNLQGTLSISLG